MVFNFGIKRRITTAYFFLFPDGRKLKKTTFSHISVALILFAIIVPFLAGKKGFDFLPENKDSASACRNNKLDKCTEASRINICKNHRVTPFENNRPKIMGKHKMKTCTLEKALPITQMHTSLSKDDTNGRTSCGKYALPDHMFFRPPDTNEYFV